ncbi:hypothetical protein LguiA_016276 [Lonicera macranthoides]
MAEEKQASEITGCAESNTLPRFYGPLGGGSNEGPKTWPEVVGMAAEEAEKKIKEEMPRALIKIIPQDHFVTMDYRTDRVRIFVDPSGKVARPPSIG